MMAIMRGWAKPSPRPGGVPPAPAQLFHGAGAGFSAPWRGTKARRQGRAAVPVGPGGSRTTTPARGGRARGLGRRRGRVDRFLLRGRRRRGARRRGAARAWRPWGAYGAPARGIGPRAPHTPRARVQQALRGRACVRAAARRSRRGPRASLLVGEMRGDPQLKRLERRELEPLLVGEMRGDPQRSSDESSSLFEFVENQLFIKIIVIITSCSQTSSSPGCLPFQCGARALSWTKSPPRSCGARALVARAA